MPYTTREALTVALFNAGVEPLHDAHDRAIEILHNLKQMGFAVIDVHHKSDLEAAQAAYDAGYPTTVPSRLAHLSAVADVDPE